MRFEQIVAVVNRVFAIVEARRIHVAAAFADAFSAAQTPSYRRPHSQWQWRLGSLVSFGSGGDRTGSLHGRQRRDLMSGMPPTGLPGQPLLVPVTCRAKRPVGRR